MGIPIFPRPRRSQPKSIIVVNDHGWITGGQAKVAIDSALKLKARGLDVCFVAGASPFDERLIQAGVDCHAVGDQDILSDPQRLRAGTRGIWNVAAARLLARCIAQRDGANTVIHVHGWAKALSPSIGPVLTRSNAAHVYTLHEYFLACPNGGFFDYRSNSICRRRPLSIDCLTTRCDARADHHKMWRVARQAVLWSAGRMPRDLRELIYMAPEQKALMLPHVSPTTRWHYLPNPVGLQPKVRVNAEANRPVVFIGRLSPEKGAVVAAKAARVAGIPIVICGDGEQRGAIHRANPEATMTGWIPPEEVTKWMMRARAIVFPSLWYECYPLVIAEALRMGLPILVSESSVAKSSVAHGISGLHVAAGDVGAWADAMRALAANDLVRSFSEAAFSAGRKLAGEDETTDRLLSIYESALCGLASRSSRVEAQ